MGVIKTKVMILTVKEGYESFNTYNNPALNIKMQNRVHLTSQGFRLPRLVTDDHLKIHIYADFPGSPVVKTSAFNAEGSIPGLGTKNLHAMRPRNKKNKQKYVFMDRMSYPELYEFGKARELSDYLFSMLKYSCSDAITIPLLEMRKCGCREAVM